MYYRLIKFHLLCLHLSWHQIPEQVVKHGHGCLEHFSLGHNWSLLVIFSSIQAQPWSYRTHPWLSNHGPWTNTKAEIIACLMSRELGCLKNWVNLKVRYSQRLLPLLPSHYGSDSYIKRGNKTNRYLKLCSFKHTHTVN